jgi:hypothetical protein
VSNNELGSCAVDLEIFEQVNQWEMIPDEWIASEFEALCFSNAEDFHFLLPAYLSYAIRNVYSSSVAVNYTIYALNPVGELGEHQKEKFKHLSDGQRESIRLVLTFLATNQDDVDWQQALSSLGYWEKVG